MVTALGHVSFGYFFYQRILSVDTRALRARCYNRIMRHEATIPIKATPSCTGVGPLTEIIAIILKEEHHLNSFMFQKTACFCLVAWGRRNCLEREKEERARFRTCLDHNTCGVHYPNSWRPRPRRAFRTTVVFNSE